MSNLVSQFLKKEGLIILVITLLGYGVALSYEIGYAIFFSFDSEYIQIDIKAIYNGIINVSAFFLVALVFMTVYKQQRSSNAQKIIQAILYIILIGTLSSPLIPKVIYSNIFTTLIICGGISILTFSYHYLANRDIKSIPILIGIAGLFLISMSTAVGISRAASESAFNVFKLNNSEYAIIRIYNGNIIGIKVENNKLSHTDKIYIPNSEVKTLFTRSMQISSRPGLLNYKDEYPDFPKNSLGDLILKEHKK